MKAELVILAQGLGRIESELQRWSVTSDVLRDSIQLCRSALSDLLRESIVLTGGVVPDDLHAIPSPPMASVMGQPSRERIEITVQTRIYAPGQLERCVLSCLDDGAEWSIVDLLQALQAEKPGTKRGSLRGCVAHLVKSGEVVWVDTGIYRRAGRRPQLSVMEG